jgi:hypothetical protein
MRTISVQEMPNGFEVETPTFWYWMKAGMAFTLGAGIVSLSAVLLYSLFLVNILLALARGGRH